MQNVIQNFARHRSVGECVEAIFHALGVQNNKVDSKCFERFIKEEEISVNEYKEILSSSIKKIICSFESSPNTNGNAKVDSKTSKDSKQRKQVLEQISFFIHGFFEYYEMYKNNYATLGASQKQLDFIDIAVFLCHLLRSLLGLYFLNLMLKI